MVKKIIDKITDKMELKDKTEALTQILHSPKMTFTVVSIMHNTLYLLEAAPS